MKERDPALENAHVDRQHQLVFQELPALVEETLASDPGAAWIPRVVRILAEYDLAQPGWPRGD